MLTIKALAESLSNISKQREGRKHFEVQPIPGEVEVLKVVIENRDELPLFVSFADTQIICITYLWGEDEIKEEKRAEMMEKMLEMNIPMPLSSFAKIDDQYVLFGAMSLHSSTEDIVLELEVLSDNALEVIKFMGDYLQ